MTSHRALFLFLLMVALATHWQRSQPTWFTVYSGPPVKEVLDVLRCHGARFQTTSLGYRLAADRAGLEATLALMRFHQLAAALCRENLANAQTLHTAEGTPYRRRWAVLNAQGQPEVRVDSGDFCWFYDPTHPDAQAEGPQRGYVARPAINVEIESQELMAHEELAQAYGRLLEKFEARLPDLVIFPYASDRIQPVH